MITSQSGLQYKEIKEGTGPRAPTGFQVTRYTAFCRATACCFCSTAQSIDVVLGSSAIFTGLLPIWWSAICYARHESRPGSDQASDQRSGSCAAWSCGSQTLSAALTAYAPAAGSGQLCGEDPPGQDL